MARYMSKYFQKWVDKLGVSSDIVITDEEAAEWLKAYRNAELPINVKGTQYDEQPFSVTTDDFNFGDITNGKGFLNLFIASSGETFPTVYAYFVIYEDNENKFHLKLAEI